MISDEIMNEIRYCYETGPDNQTLVFDNEDEKKRFWEWFQKEAEHFAISNSPNQSLVGDQNIAGRCFGNSQTICLNNNLDYCEGFHLKNDDSIFHGFNLNSDGLVEDYTALSNTDDFATETKDYYGVVIDSDFICELNLEKLTEDQKNIPFLVLEYFRRHNSV